MNDSLSRSIERRLLPFVQKPNRYAGLELNRIIKENSRLTWALGFPDLYEIAMCHMGSSILYHILNHKLEGVYAQRVYLPAEDAIQRLRQEKIPLFTLESRTPLTEMDVLGISLSYEMALPGMLEMMDLGDIPIHAKDRTDEHPLVIVGGPVTYNPEPFVDFIDAVVIGDGEEIAIEISQILLEAKANKKPRWEKLQSLSQLEGIYIPALHNSQQIQEATSKEQSPDSFMIKGRTIDNLDFENYPVKPLVPLLEIAHDRIALEVMRGCTRGCRFCHAGMIYRPVRERPVKDIVEQARLSLESTGYNEISLTSLSTSDYGALSPLIEELKKLVIGKGISLSFPSLRPDSFTREMADSFPEGRKGSLTFAPEAGTQRLRDVINKNSREEDLLKAVDLSFSLGYSSIKLYFMIGLPSEEYSDLDGIIDLARKVEALKHKGNQKVSVSISPFVPKSHTPFQWFAQDSLEVSQKKLQYLREKFRKTRIRFMGHSPYNAIYEGAIARGDRRINQVIEKVWRKGGILEGWFDRFDSRRWNDSFQESGLDPREFIKARSHDEILPWNHITKGITDKFYTREWKRAEKEETRLDCRQGRCDACGLMEKIKHGEKVCQLLEREQSVENTKVESALNVEVKCIARIKYQRTEVLRWTGHLDLLRFWERCINRIPVPIAYSQGYHPHMKISFGPPLPVGCLSESEYIDLELSEIVAAPDLLSIFRDSGIEGIDIKEIAVFSGKESSITSVVNLINYEIDSPGLEHYHKYIKSWMDLREFKVKRQKKKGIKEVDIRNSLEDAKLLDDERTLRLTMRVNTGAVARFDELYQAWSFPENPEKAPRRLSMFGETTTGLQNPVEMIVSSSSFLSYASTE